MLVVTFITACAALGDLRVQRAITLQPPPSTSPLLDTRPCIWGQSPEGSESPNPHKNLQRSQIWTPFCLPARPVSAAGFGLGVAAAPSHGSRAT